MTRWNRCNQTLACERREMEGGSEEEEKEEERGWWWGEGQSAALHDKDVGVVVRILCTQAGYYLFLHMSFQPIPPRHASWRRLSNSFMSQSERISFLFKPVITATQC